MIKIQHEYDDIIELPHHRSETHPHMSMHDRAAQFGSFAALTGHKDMIKETERLTEREIDLDEDTLALLDEKLIWLRGNIDSHPEIAITYFCPDEKKEGGRYESYSGAVKKIDEQEKQLVFANGFCVAFHHIVELEIFCKRDEEMV